MKLFKHTNCTDIAMEMVKTFIKPNGDMKVKARWFNIVNPENIFFIDEENVIIKKEEIQNWKPYK